MSDQMGFGFGIIDESLGLPGFNSALMQSPTRMPTFSSVAEDLFQSPSGIFSNPDLYESCAYFSRHGYSEGLVQDLEMAAKVIRHEFQARLADLWLKLFEDSEEDECYICMVINAHVDWREARARRMYIEKLLMPWVEGVGLKIFVSVLE